MGTGNEETWGEPPNPDYGGDSVSGRVWLKRPIQPGLDEEQMYVERTEIILGTPETEHSHGQGPMDR